MAAVQVIFFDAVGTLFGLKDSVGQIYGQRAQGYGVRVDPLSLDQAFHQVFKSAPPPTFPKTERSRLAEAERQWWRQVVWQTFATAGQGSEPEGFPDFDAYFEDVFELFASPEPWQLYGETLEVLQALDQQGIPLGIISNFDSRLPRVLRSLAIDSFFQFVILSTQSSAAKPQPQIFSLALEQAQVEANQALHVGDSLSMDYLGATQAGLQALWLNRDRELTSNPAPQVPVSEQIPDLTGILSWLSLA